MKKGLVLSIIISLLFLGGGLGLIIFSISRGNSKFGLFFIIPFVQTSDPLGALGVLMIVIGFIALMISISLARFTFNLGSYKDALGDEYEIDDVEFIFPGGSSKKQSLGSKERPKNIEQPKPGFSGGGVIFIGPFPIVFGSNKKIGRNMLYIAVAITLIMVVLTLLWLFAAAFAT